MVSIFLSLFLCFFLAFFGESVHERHSHATLMSAPPCPFADDYPNHWLEIWRDISARLDADSMPIDSIYIFPGRGIANFMKHSRYSNESRLGVRCPKRSAPPAFPLLEWGAGSADASAIYERPPQLGSNFWFADAHFHRIPWPPRRRFESRRTIDSDSSGGMEDKTGQLSKRNGVKRSGAGWKWWLTWRDILSGNKHRTKHHKNSGNSRNSKKRRKGEMLISPYKINTRRLWLLLSGPSGGLLLLLLLLLLCSILLPTDPGGCQKQYWTAVWSFCDIF